MMRPKNLSKLAVAVFFACLLPFTLTAQTADNPLEYIVEFNVTGGTVSPATSATGSGGKLASLPTPVKEGYAFEGWFTAETGGTAVTTSTAFSANATIYAQWTLIHTVTFDANGGTVTPETGATGVGGKLASLPTPIKESYAFEGWFTAATGGTAVNTGTAFSEAATVYAQWTLIHTVAFNANGGTVTPASDATGVGGKLSSLPTPTKSGYTFNGWFTTATDDGTAVTTSTVFSANATVHARWTLNIYTITFDAGGGTVTPASGTTGEGWKLAELPTPAKTNYIFNGWYTAATDGTEVSTSTAFSADVTVYARWTLTSYTIKYNLNGGTNHVSNPASYTSESSVTLNSPTRSGYAFCGWYDKSFFANDYITSIPAGSTGNKEYWAKWVLSTDVVYTNDFESGSWNAGTGTAQTNRWYRNDGFGYPGSRYMTIGNGTDASISGVSERYTDFRPSISHIYTDITFPESSSDFVMTFNFRGVGEGDWYAIYDYMTLRYSSSTSSTPVEGSVFTDGTLLGDNYRNNPNWTQKTITLPAATFSGKTMRFVFTWINDDSGGSQPPAAIDDISIKISKAVVFVPVTNITGVPTTVLAGTSVTLPSSVTPYNATNKTITWSIVNAGGTGAELVDGVLSIPAVIPVSGAVTVRATVMYGTASGNYTQDFTITPVYTVTFNSQNGSAVASQTISHGGKITEPADPTLAGYYFDGWFREAACTNAWDFGVDAVTSAVTLYAKWTTIVIHLLTFNSQGGSYEGTEHIEHGSKATAPAAPARTGYTFGGWYKEAACTNAWNFSTEVVTATTTLYAKWTINTYPITFSAGANGTLAATVDGSAITTGALVQYGKNVVFTATPAVDYKVNGWTLNGSTVSDNVTNTYTLTSVSAVATVAVSFTKSVSVLTPDRVIPQPQPNEEATVIAPVSQLSGEFTAGPNPVSKQSGIVNFYRQGKRVAACELQIYDATGNVVNKVKIHDKVIGSQARRQVGKWDLRDKNGRIVSEGTYLVKGVIKTSDGKSEKISLILSVR
jgi:uncharacterized repeat protein (TIGR02543 family)